MKCDKRPANAAGWYAAASAVDGWVHDEASAALAGNPARPQRRAPLLAPAAPYATAPCSSASRARLQSRRFVGTGFLATLDRTRPFCSGDCVARLALSAGNAPAAPARRPRLRTPAL